MTWSKQKIARRRLEKIIKEETVCTDCNGKGHIDRIRGCDMYYGWCHTCNKSGERYFKLEEKLRKIIKLLED